MNTIFRPKHIDDLLYAFKEKRGMLLYGASRKPVTQRDYERYLAATNRNQRLQDILTLMDGQDEALVKNKYAYDATLDNLEQVEHYVFWTLNDEMTEEQAFELIGLKAFEVLGQMPNFIFWQNVQAQKSISQIKHWQVFLWFDKIKIPVNEITD